MSVKISNSFYYVLALLMVVIAAGWILKAGGYTLFPRKDAHTPEVLVSDWGKPRRLEPPINTPRPEDAIEISRDGKRLYFLKTKDLLDKMTPAEILSRPNGTYVAARTGGPTEFGEPVFFDLGKGVNQSLDAELSFTGDGSRVYFHSVRAGNTGYRQNPPQDDFLDIYVADMVEGKPGAARNLGPPVNSAHPDGEHAIHPDGITLYFTSSRPGGMGNNDMWISKRGDGSWSDPVNLGKPINSEGNDLQPAFTSDGNTLYFTSDRDAKIGMAIYRSNKIGDSWSKPEPVIKGIVGEASITGDGKYLYFVHILTDSAGVFDSDVWVSERRRERK